MRLRRQTRRIWFWLWLTTAFLGLGTFNVRAGAAPLPGGAGGLRVPSMSNDCAPAAAPAVRVDGSLDQLFANQLGPGWVGGDASYSTQLPDGREAFVFSDSLIGTAEPNGTATFTGFAHNSELYGWLPYLHSDYGGTYTSPQPLVPDGNGDQWQVAATFVEKGNQVVFVNEFAPTGGAFEQFTGRSGLAVLAVRRHGVPTFTSVVDVPTDPTTQWGNALVGVGRYTYIYGEVADPTTGQQFGMKVARAPRFAVLDAQTWQYWDGTAWAAGESHALTIATGNDLTGVVPQRDRIGFEAVSIPGSLFDDTTIDLSYACAPQGPWSAASPVYAIPTVAGLAEQIAYDPTFHPELSQGWGFVVSYNVNTTAGYLSLQTAVHGYQPHFVLLRDAPWVKVTDPLPAETPEASLPVLLPLLGAAAIGIVLAVRNRRRRVSQTAGDVPDGP